MIRYLDSVLQESTENMDMKAATPAAENIFKVCYERKTKYLPEDQAQTFHNTME